MTETPAQPAQSAPPAAAAAPGYFERIEDKILPHARHAEADVSSWAADIRAALQDHAGSVFDVAGDVVQLAKLADPADASLFAALDALVPKVLAMAESAARIAGAALKG
jgi:hypothetical protein